MTCLTVASYISIIQREAETWNSWFRFDRLFLRFFNELFELLLVNRVLPLIRKNREVVTTEKNRINASFTPFKRWAKSSAVDLFLFQSHHVGFAAPPTPNSQSLRTGRSTVKS